MQGTLNRGFEHGLVRLANRVRDDREFAVELYGALCNADWRHDDGTVWPGGTWRYVGELVADLRDCGEDYLGFYCSGGEGEISHRVAMRCRPSGSAASVMACGF